MGRVLFAIFLAMPIVEIALFIQIGQWIGLGWTLAGIVLTALLGVVVVRLTGLSLIAELRATAGAGGLPARRVADGLMVGIAGAMLIVPGYFTDALALLLLIPPLRGLLYDALAARIRVVDLSPGAGGYHAPRTGRPDVIELNEDDWRDR